MKFGPLATVDATGAILAHSLRLASGVLKKGTRLTPEHLADLTAAGIAEVTVARLEPGDVGEDAAAARIGACSASHSRNSGATSSGRRNMMNEECCAPASASTSPISLRNSSARPPASPEIFPNSVRTKGQSLGCGTHWVFAALITLLMPFFLGRFTPQAIFSLPPNPAAK